MKVIKTGRYLTVLKPQWSCVPDLPSHFMCGSMSRSIDIFSGTSGQTLARLYDADHITAVPTVVGSHPNLPNRYFGATASGKVSYFGVLDGDILETEDDDEKVKMGEEEDVKEEKPSVSPPARKRAKK